MGALLHGMPWCLTQDSKHWPYDPPLSDTGLVEAEELGVRLHRVLGELDADLHVVITSPYLRCVQTAACVCKSFGKSTKLLIDNSLGEIYGPCIMGNEPENPVRPLQQSTDFCLKHGVESLEVRKVLGQWPAWPETLKGARQRFAARFVDYVKRGYTAHRNFLIVSHADCVGGALTLIPCGTCRHNVEKVNFAGHFTLVSPRCESEASSEAEVDPMQQLDKAAAAAVRRMAALNPDKHWSPELSTPTPRFRPDCVRSRGAALVRREEALQAVRAKKEWSILQGYDEDHHADVSDLGNDLGSGISLGDGWFLQTSGIVLRGKRKSLASRGSLIDEEVVRDWGIPLLLPSADESQRWQQLLESLPQAPLAKEEGRRSSGRFSVCSLELFTGTSTSNSWTKGPRASSLNDELESTSIWTGQTLVSNAWSDSLLVPSRQSIKVAYGSRSSFLRRYSFPDQAGTQAASAAALQEVAAVEEAHASTQLVPADPSGVPPVLLGKEEKLQTEQGDSQLKKEDSLPSRTILPPVLPVDLKEKRRVFVEEDQMLLPDKSPLYQRRRGRKGILSEDSMANASTSDGSCSSLAG